MKGIQNDDDYGIVAEINMIPLIDVSLVLLIIFMVMTPILVQSQIKLKLPTAGNVDEVTDATPLRISVSADGTIYVDQKVVSEEQLTAVIKAQALGAEASVIVEGDQDSNLGKIVKVFDAARAAGISKIGVAVQPPPAPPRRR